MVEQIVSAPLALAGVAIAGMQRERYAALPFDDVLIRLRAAILESDLWLLHEIDPQALLRRVGYGIPATRQLLFFHPRLMLRLLAGDSAAILEVPLKFAVLEEARGTRLRWLDPIVTFARYDNNALNELGEMLAIECERIAERVIADQDATAQVGLVLA